MADWQEGDVVVDSNGNQRVLQGNQWVDPKATAASASPPTSTAADAAKATLPALERTGVALATVPNTVGSLVSQGINAAGDYAFPDWKSSPPGKVMGAAEKYFGNKDYNVAQKKVEETTGPLYSAQTPGGKIWEGAVGAAPLGVIGEGAVVPNVVRALMSGAASEGAGQATQGTPWEVPARMAAGAGTYGLTGAAQTPQIIANTPVRAAAQGLENAGVRVPASTLANRGGRLMATMEGGPIDLDTPVSDAMKQQGGIPRPPGNTDQYSRLVEARRNALQAQGNVLGAQTNIPPTATQPLRQQLAADVANHIGQFGGMTGAGGENPAVQQALANYDQATMGGQPLTGVQYQRLHQAWNADPDTRPMAQHLDAAMDAAHPGVWDGWRQNWADYEGLRAASEAMGGEATAKPLSPDKVVSAMYRRTPMRDTAENAQTVRAAQPAPYDFSKAGKVLAGVGAAAGGAAGAYHGGIPGAGEAGLLGLFGLPAIASAIPAAVGPIFRSAAGQNLLRNLDPRVVSALLAQQGVVGKGTPGEQPTQ
jgi:hypothetical protein